MARIYITSPENLKEELEEHVESFHSGMSLSEFVRGAARDKMRFEKNKFRHTEDLAS